MCVYIHRFIYCLCTKNVIIDARVCIWDLAGCQKSPASTGVTSSGVTDCGLFS